MLATFPHSSTRPSHNLTAPVPAQHRRKRGGQPGNTNAYRHGLYAGAAPRPNLIPQKSIHVQKDSSIQEKELHEHMLALCKSELRANRSLLANCLLVSLNKLPHSEILSQVRTATLIAGRIVKIKKYLFELDGRQAQVRSLARDLPALLRWEFSELGVPARPAFVPRKLNILNARCRWAAPRLIDAQWVLLREAVVSQRADLDYYRKYPRRKPLPPDRFLLEGILWKLASGLRWRDLMDKYPVRQCQELYSALVRSGRMQTVYNRLLGFLNTNGEATLSALVERGCFVISGNRVLLAPLEKPAWEKYTALLLLQQAYHASRSIKSSCDWERRRHGGYYRVPHVRVSDSNQQFDSRPSRLRPQLTPAWPVAEKVEESCPLEPDFEICETKSFGNGFLYGKIRRSKIQRKHDP